MNAIKRIGSNTSSPKKRTSMNSNENIDPTLSPELTPIVTLLSAQTHRRYHEGIFMLFYDLNSDGKPGDRKWCEVYGILTGNQLAYWDAAKLSEFRNNPEALLTASSKPQYINFTDSIFNAMIKLPSSSGDLENVIVVSTTLKNRYILQFKSSRDLAKWYLALRLSTFEYTSLQEAYTGALLSARGSRLSDIRVVLAEKRYDHEDWVSVRYGSGMAWKRCYAVVEPSVAKKSKFIPGKVSFYENEKKQKKFLMATITAASAVYAVYPQTHTLIDHSTMLKVEASISFINSNKKKESPKETSIFLMPEQHSAVPGFDTLIRFLIPLLDSFGLYGRPKRLNADKMDLKSLLFGLPTLPHVHYLEVDDLLALTKDPYLFNWDVKEWFSQIKNILKVKLQQGYDGCGSNRGLNGAMNSLSLKDTNSSTNSNRSDSPTISNRSLQTPTSSNPPNNGNFNNPNGGLKQNPKISSNVNLPNINGGNVPNSGQNGRSLPRINLPNVVSPASNLRNLDVSVDQTKHSSLHLSNIYSDYSELSSPSDQFNSDRQLVHDGSKSSLPYPNQESLFDDDDDNDSDRTAGKLPYPKNDSYSDDEDLHAPIVTTTLTAPATNGSSASSIRSPMTQFNDFNNQFQQSTKPSQPGDSNGKPFDYSNKSRLIGPQTIPNDGKTNLIKSQPTTNLSSAINPQGGVASLNSRVMSSESIGSGGSKYSNQVSYPVQPQPPMQNPMANGSGNLVRPMGNSKPLNGPQRLPPPPQQNIVPQQAVYIQPNPYQKLAGPGPSPVPGPQMASQPQQVKYGQPNPYQKPNAQMPSANRPAPPPQQMNGQYGGPPPQHMNGQYGAVPPPSQPIGGQYGAPPQQQTGRPFAPQQNYPPQQNGYAPNGNGYTGQQPSQRGPAAPQNGGPESFRSYQGQPQHQYQYQPQAQVQAPKVPKVPHKPGAPKRLPPQTSYGMDSTSNHYGNAGQFR